MKAFLVGSFLLASQMAFGNAGFVSRNSTAITNELSITRILVIHRCINGREVMREVAEDATRVYFRSETLAPTPGARVVIRNVHPLFQRNQPYSDRGYDEGIVSEKINLKTGTSHETRYFILRPGLNDFDYQIKKGDQILESGTFSANVKLVDGGIRKRTTTDRRLCPSER